MMMMTKITFIRHFLKLNFNLTTSFIISTPASNVQFIIKFAFKNETLLSNFIRNSFYMHDKPEAKIKVIIIFK